MRRALTHGYVIVFCLGVLCLDACSRTAAKPVPTSWNAKAAAAYLDAREVTWMNWPGAARDHQTFCISCHTVLPYVLSRPMLRTALQEQGPSDDERKIADDVRKRVLLWNETEPYYKDEGYGDGKPAQSRGTESVLNALILASFDSQQHKLNDLTRAAFADMWGLQIASGPSKGAWFWLRFGMEPWEANDSQYYGAALAAIATGIAPENYRLSPDIQPNVQSLIAYLRQNARNQSLANRAVLLWAAAKLPGLLNRAEQDAIIEQIRDYQRDDGGWELSSAAWPNNWSLHSIIRSSLRSDWTLQDTNSDGYATA